MFDRTVLEAAEKMQKRIEELRQAKEPCRQLELSLATELNDHSVQPSRGFLALRPAVGQHLILNTTESYLKLCWRAWSKSRRWMQLGEIWRRGGIILLLFPQLSCFLSLHS